MDDFDRIEEARERNEGLYYEEHHERAVSDSELQQVWMHAGDLERLEEAAECAARGNQLELATALWAIILRVRTETGWTVSNVEPIR